MIIRNYIHILYNLYSIIMWLTILILSVFIFVNYENEVSDVIISLTVTGICLFITPIKFNNRVKFCVVFLAFILCYFQFINHNVTMKYYFVYEELSELDEYKYLNALYGSNLIYTIYLQWMVLLHSLSLPKVKNIGVFCIVVISVLFVVQQIFLFSNSNVLWSNVFIYIIPICHYVLFLVTMLISKILAK